MNFSKHANQKKIQRLNSRYTKIMKLMGTSSVRVLFFSLLLVAVLGISGGIGVAKAILDASPELDFDSLVPVGYTSFIRNQDGVILQELSTGDANRIYVEIDEIPKHVQDAFIVIEDERFYEHNGIDMRGIFRAIFVNLKSGDLTEGASTITQQVIKNNVLSSVKSFERKIQEQYLAIQVEKFLSKDKILELYLNTAGLGRGTNGVQAAAGRYFNKDVGELTIAEAAVIAGITQRPSDYDPVTNPENNRNRQLIILQYLLNQGKISNADYLEAKEENVYDKIQITNQEFETKSDYTYFVDEVIRRVASDLEVQKGYTATQAINLIYRGGLDIYITQDIGLQNILDQSFADENNFPTIQDDYNVKLMYTASVQTTEGVFHHYEEKLLQSDEEALEHIELLKSEWVGETDTLISDNALFIPQPQAAMVVIDYHTGQVKAMTGGRGQKIGNQVLNRATMSKRQPGSTFKILAAYLPALDTMGLTLAKVYDDVPYTIQIPGAGSYSPKNWYDHAAYNYWGLSTIREGIQWSMNLLAVKTMNEIGIQTGFDYLKNLGFTTLVERRDVNGTIFSDKNIVLPLGGLTDGVTLLELTNAYGAIANNGVYIEPSFYTKVLAHDGSLLLLKEPFTQTVMKETTSYLLTNSMEDVVKAGTGTAVRFNNMSIAGKTGTTSDSKDLAFIGYTPYYVAGVWLGHDDPERMSHNKRYHTLIWRDVMSKIHEDLENKSFQRPDGIVQATICTKSGKLAVSGLCTNDPRGSTARTEIFAAGTAPTETCDVHVKITVCKDSGLLPTVYCPPGSLVQRVYTARTEPLNPASWDPARPPRIRDYVYELPSTIENEYCNIHTKVEPTPQPLPNALPSQPLE
jgi:penicillin-binding protein 1A